MSVPATEAVPVWTIECTHKEELVQVPSKQVQAAPPEHENIANLADTSVVPLAPTPQAESALDPQAQFRDVITHLGKAQAELSRVDGDQHWNILGPIAGRLTLLLLTGNVSMNDKVRDAALAVASRYRAELGSGVVPSAHRGLTYAASMLIAADQYQA